MLDMRLTTVNAWFVHADPQLTGPRDGRAIASMVVLIEGVDVVAMTVLGGVGSFDQRMHHSHQQDQDPGREHAGTGDTRLNFEYQEHEDGHSCQIREERGIKRRIYVTRKSLTFLCKKETILVCSNYWKQNTL